MPRAIIGLVLLAIIIYAVAFSGCAENMARPIITGNASDNVNTFNAVSGVLIRAVPEDGGAPVHAITDDNGSFSLSLKPYIRYEINGLCYDPYGQYSSVVFRYTNGEPCRDITLATGETITLKAIVYRPHPPKSLFMAHDPVTGNVSFVSPAPASVSGHVYLDGKAVSGAYVEAVSAYGKDRAYTITDDGGAYVLALDSRTQYNIIATYQGIRHTVWPVLVYDNETGVYDINLTRTPRSALTGVAPDNEPWLRQSGAVTIEAIPFDGGTPITTNIGPDFSYSLDVEPLVYYNISGKFRGPDGNYHDVTFAYRNGVTFSGFMLRPNETALADYFTIKPHAYLEDATAY
ncbi:carboxypeptidase-like regulatory domain-containing protein [Methanocella conradii]|uniref:carboxypeptidase-like regulatory domain-containing protein n=1 Tax=Methanocella conradii TaxID=1175444 RepID=UPI00157D0948|nr:carboxypeptidase-like regulatory domain-containing protein [Methanocella conradii]